MNKVLQSAIDRYNELSKKNFLIHPISQEDAEIMIEIVQALKRFNANELIKILEGYKFEKDSEVRDTLMQWNIDHPIKPTKIEEKVVEDKEKVPPAPFIQIANRTLRAFHIFAWDELDEIDDDGDCTYSIVLNPMPEGVDLKKIPLYANEKIVCNSEDHRNKILTNLKSHYREQLNIDFLDFNEDE